MEPVSWERIGRAVDFYKHRGYKYIEAPWIVSKDPYYATKPDNAPDVHILGKYFVASGEQSFVELLTRGKKIDKAVCCTPCFRVEEPQDYHFLYFMKVELIKRGSSEDELSFMLAEALCFFDLICGIPCKVEDMGDGTFDLVGLNSGIELGSYGIREWEDHSWIYGTGLAEPRASQVLKEELNRQG